MTAAKTKESTPKDKPAVEPVEFVSDAWERFEEAVDRVVKSPPKPRQSDKSRADHQTDPAS